MPAVDMPTMGQLRRRGLRFGVFRGAADDARKSTTDLGLPNIDWSKLDPSRLDLSKVDFSKLDLPARAEVSKQIRKASKEQLRRASKELNRTLPGRRPSRLPFALLGALGGILVGWIVATSPTARAAIERAVSGAKHSVSGAIAEMQARGTSDEESDLAAWTNEARTPVASDTYAAAIGVQREPITQQAGVGVGPGRQSDETTPGG
jgi:hypothetical protein